MKHRRGLKGIFLDILSILTRNNTWSGVQTFLDGTLGLRNVANTFTSFFTNVATASRTWTLPNVTGTLSALNLAQTWTAVQTFSSTTVYDAPTTYNATANYFADINMRDFKIKNIGFFNMNTEALTIDTNGAVVPNASYVSIDTFEAASTDDLDDITKTNADIGSFLTCRLANNARDPTIKDNTGNIQMAGDFTLTHINDTWFGLFRTTAGAGAFVELGRSDNT